MSKTGLPESMRQMEHSGPPESRAVTAGGGPDGFASGHADSTVSGMAVGSTPSVPPAVIPAKASRTRRRRFREDAQPQDAGSLHANQAAVSSVTPRSRLKRMYEIHTPVLFI